MKKMITKLKYIFTVVIFFISCTNAESQRKQKSNKYHNLPKINGVNFVAPPKEIDQQWTNDLKTINVGWVSLIPYAFSRPNLPDVNYSAERQHWGESLEGLRTNVKQAHGASLKVMIKPQVWLQKGGWIGDFDLSTEEEWKVWETSYKNYMMYFVKLAAEEKVEMICIGTEYRNAVKKRPAFWINLINDIRKIYSGKLTYCANWDDYDNVSFWAALDYVGISGYFPLSEKQNPTLKDLEKAWTPIKTKLLDFSQKVDKQILFTEYGYRSMDQPAWRSWELEYQERPINNAAQAIAYEALYKTFWKEKWFAGGFAWKWYSSFRRMDPQNNHDWTPQNKKAQEVMAQFYGNHH